jgi:hypothetical protein
MILQDIASMILQLPFRSVKINAIAVAIYPTYYDPIPTGDSLDMPLIDSINVTLRAL